MYSKYKPYAISAIITFTFEILCGIVTYFGLSGNNSVIKPSFAPPTAIFLTVWIALVLLMSVSATIIFKSNDIRRSPALFIYVTQLAVNFWWCVFFFGFGLYMFSFILLILLWLMVLMMTIIFYRIKHIAGLIQILYLIWLAFAAYINFMVWFLNR